MIKSKKYFNVEDLKKDYRFRRCLFPHLSKFLIDKFLDDNGRSFEVRGHVNGYRVTAKDSDFGEITFSTGENIETMMMECIDRWDKIIAKKESEKIERLARRKKEIENELRQVSEELTDIMLQTFEQDSKLKDK